MFTSRCILKVLKSSFFQFKMKHVFTLRFLAVGVQPLCHLIKFSWTIALVLPELGI